MGVNVEIEELEDRIAEQAANLDAATHRLLTDLRALDQSGAWYPRGFSSCAAWLSWRVGWSTGTARDRVRVANRLGELPLIDDALRRGEVSYCKVRAMTRVATPANEAALLEDARFSTGHQLETLCRKYATVVRGATKPNARDDQLERYVTRRVLENGMVKIEVVCHPEEAETIWAALTKVAREGLAPQAAAVSKAAHAETIADATDTDATDMHATQDHTPLPEAGAASASNTAPQNRSISSFDRVSAMVTLAEDVLRGPRKDRSPTELVVTVPVDVLMNPTTTEVPLASMGEAGCVSAETARRLACDAGVVYMTEDAHGNTVSVGRKTRSIPPSLKRALLRRDRTCRFPGCTNHVFLEGHHIQHWAEGGETSLTNMVGLCGFHHRFLHEYGYRVELDEEQVPSFFDPSGKPVPIVPRRPSSRNRGWPAIEAQNRELAITSETPACGYGGEPVDYGWIIDGLVRLDGL